MPTPKPHRLIDAELEQTMRRARQDLELAQARLKTVAPKK